MTLSERDKKVLARVELNAGLPIRVLADEIGTTQKQVEYRLHSLQEKAVIHPTIFVDMYRIGYTDFVLYFSGADAKLISFLQESSVVTWVSELSGPYQYGMAMFARHVEEFSSFTDEISKRFGNIFIQKAIRLSRTFTRFNRKYLDPDASVTDLSFGRTLDREDIDETDDRLLLALSDGDGLSLRRAALSLRLPTTTVHHRIRRLQERGVIAGKIYSVDPSRYGAVLFNVLVYAKGFREGLREELFTWCRKHPHVVHFVECVGQWDFEIGVEVEGAERITPILLAIQDRFGQDMVKLETLTILRNLKYVFYRPVRKKMAP